MTWRRSVWVPSLAALVSFALTWPRIAREVVLFGDSAELVAAAKLWGVPHPPGYPLWTLLGHLASLVPVGGVAFRVHVTSAIFHALAVGLVAQTALELSDSIVAALASALALTLAKSYLLGSTYAEVFPLNDAFYALCLFLAVRARGAPAASRSSWLVALAGVTGLAAFHHQMTVLGLPAVALVAWPALGAALRARPRAVLTLAGAFLLPALLSVGLLLLAARRHTLVSYGDIHDPASLFRVLLRSDYGGLLSASHHPSRSPAGDRVGAFALLVAGSFGPVALLAALVGTLVVVYRDRQLSLGLLAAWLVPGPLFAALNRVGVDGEAQTAFFERFTTMAHVPLALATGLGAAWLAERLPRALPARAFAMLAIGAVPGLAAFIPAEAVDPSHDRAGVAFVHDLYRGVPDGSLVLISGDLYTGATQFLCATEDVCDRLIIAAPGQLFLPWKMTELRRRYPDLRLPEGRMRLSRSHEIVQNEIARREVFVVPSVIVRDDVLPREFEFVPMRLLTRVVAHEEAIDVERERFLAYARALASGEGCEGCRLDWREIERPSQHVEVMEAYAAMFTSHAGHAQSVGHPDEALWLARRARSLEALMRR